MDTCSFEDIFRRFQSVTNTSTQQELADVLGIKQSTISESKKRGAIPPGWYLSLFEQSGVNPDWLRYGKGPKFLRSAEGRYLEPESGGTPLGQGISLPYFDSGSMFGKVWETPSGTVMLPELYVGKNIHVLRMTTDEFAPTVRQNAFVGVDVSCVTPSSGKIFAVSMPEGVVLKRVFCYSDTLLLRTDDVSQPFFSVPVAESDCLIGRAMWVFQDL